MRTDLLRRGRGWRIRIAALALALVAATSVAAVWHEAHAGDQECAVCQLRHQPAATSPGSLQIEPATTSEPAARNVHDRAVTLAHARRLPARAPPA